MSDSFNSPISAGWSSFLHRFLPFKTRQFTIQNSAWTDHWDGFQLCVWFVRWKNRQKVLGFTHKKTQHREGNIHQFYLYNCHGVFRFPWNIPLDIAHPIDLVVKQIRFIVSHGWYPSSHIRLKFPSTKKNSKLLSTTQVPYPKYIPY